MVGTNSIYSFLTTNQQYSSGNLIDPLFSMAILLVGFSGQNASSQKKEDHISGNTLNTVKLLLPYFSTVLLFIVMVIQNEVMNSLVTGSALVILLIIIRQVVTIRENHHLLDQLSDLAEKLEQKVEVRTRQLNGTNQRLNQAIQELTHVAYHDALTGLSNRRKFKEQLEESIVVARKEKRKFALLLLDLDRFKTINDTLGHEMGDLLLKEIGSRLSDCLGERGMVFRLGGDEFTVILPDIEKNDPAKLAEEIQQCISSPFLLEGHKLRTATTTGISIFPDHGETIKVLLKKADTAMYKAKELGKGSFQFYKDGDDSINSLKIVLENDLYEALERNELEIHYQPQMDMLEKKVIGLEALVRWNHPKLGRVFPMDFIHLAEETGLIVPIGEWVLRNACEQVKDWQEQQPDLTLSVNISPRQIFREDFDQEIMDILEETQFKPSSLNLEITENIFMYSVEKVNAKLDRLKEAGIQISIDDFGTGYSSLSYLTKLPITSLKIDKMFIKNMLTKNEDYAVVKAIVNMAETLGLQVVAEGVESEEQMDRLIQLGCYILQGYLIGKPRQSPDFTFNAMD
ncbi:bifunctional diguanylate cyclase/phosphodiesterase [Bacillus sp. V59.32b]|uniref:putative bifunctional diguanylate cyclase/phosphodiesterase n=1 Tax=Bacillus sp. V59.32b TaxID=1758642 RepID=UPI00135AD657|nr:GGDEF domain-containing phosphodiesterase [Bacillus sp. V59.32b]